MNCVMLVRVHHIRLLATCIGHNVKCVMLVRVHHIRLLATGIGQNEMCDVGEATIDNFMLRSDQMRYKMYYCKSVSREIYYLLVSIDRSM